MTNNIILIFGHRYPIFINPYWPEKDYLESNKYGQKIGSVCDTGDSTFLPTRLSESPSLKDSSAICIEKIFNAKLKYK